MPVSLRHPVVREEYGHPPAAKLHLAQQLERLDAGLGPHDPVVLPVPPAQVARHRPRHRRVVVDREDQGPGRGFVHARQSPLRAQVRNGPLTSYVIPSRLRPLLPRCEEK